MKTKSILNKSGIMAIVSFVLSIAIYILSPWLFSLYALSDRSWMYDFGWLMYKYFKWGFAIDDIFSYGLTVISALFLILAVYFITKSAKQIYSEQKSALMIVISLIVAVILSVCVLWFLGALFVFFVIGG